MDKNDMRPGRRDCRIYGGRRSRRDCRIPSEQEMKSALTDRCGEQIADAFGRATVAICGLGGLGSNIAVSLVRAGVGTLILIDFDKVDITNLNRQLEASTQRLQLLTDLERNMNGYQHSVKTVMKAAQNHRLRGIIGPVSSIPPEGQAVPEEVQPEQQEAPDPWDMPF